MTENLHLAVIFSDYLFTSRVARNEVFGNIFILQYELFSSY